MANPTTKAATAKIEELVDQNGEALRQATADAPQQVREFAEKSVQQAKEGYARFKSAAEEASDALEDAYATSTKGYRELSRKSVEHARSNLNAHFDFLQALIGAKSVSQAVELQTSYARQQFEVITAQAKELTSLAQKAASDSSKPLQDAATKGFSYAKAS